MRLTRCASLLAVWRCVVSTGVDDEVLEDRLRQSESTSKVVRDLHQRPGHFQEARDRRGGVPTGFASEEYSFIQPPTPSLMGTAEKTGPDIIGKQEGRSTRHGGFAGTSACCSDEWEGAESEQ